MHVETVPVLPPGRDRRAGRLVAVALPVIALVAIVAGGALGGEAAPAPTARPQPRAADGVVPAPADGRSTAPTVTTVTFPTEVLGLAVRPIAALLAERHAGALGDEVVAVAGHLTIDPRRLECRAQRSRDRTFCRRGTILTERGVALLETTPDGFEFVRDRFWHAGAHLHPQLPPGVSTVGLRRLPVTLDEVAQPVGVVLLGRFDDPRAEPCRPNGRHCGEEFVVERIAWSDDGWLGPRSDRDRSAPDRPALATEQARAAVQAALGPSTLLLLAGSDRAGLRWIDPQAAETLPGDQAGPLWYARTLRLRSPAAPGANEGPDRSRPVRWAVIDDATGRLLAAGPDRGE